MTAKIPKAIRILNTLIPVKLMERFLASSKWKHKLLLSNDHLFQCYTSFLLEAWCVCVVYMYVCVVFLWPLCYKEAISIARCVCEVCAWCKMCICGVSHCVSVVWAVCCLWWGVRYVCAWVWHVSVCVSHEVCVSVIWGVCVSGCEVSLMGRDVSLCVCHVRCMCVCLW